MKEDFLHYVWKHQLFSKKKLLTTSNHKIEIVKPGVHNFNSGPDFGNATILIDNLRWVGNVEIHIQSSDWYVHQHEQDERYDSVILHVVWEYNVEVFDQNNQHIPTLELAKLIDNKLLHSYQDLIFADKGWVPCESSISSIDSFLLERWKTRLYFERLEGKSLLIQKLLDETKNDYEAVLFKLLLKNFGLKANGDAFLNLANSFPFSMVQKLQNYPDKLAALLFGQAGFLEEVIEEGYYTSMQEEYRYLKKKLGLSSIYNKQFQFFRMRPTNFPTIRIAQIAALYGQRQNLFSSLMESKNLNDFYELFAITLAPYWNTHYTFYKVSPSSVKRITKSFVDLLLINTIIPLKFNYLKSRSAVDEEVFLELLYQLKPEKNSIISKFLDLGIHSKNAFESQALLQLKSNYCSKKQCLQCAIGNAILKE